MGHGGRQRSGELRPGQLAGGLQPPQRQQGPVIRVEPVAGVGRLPALAGQLGAQQGQALGVLARRIEHLVEGGGPLGVKAPPVEV